MIVTLISSFGCSSRLDGSRVELPFFFTEAILENGKTISENNFRAFIRGQTLCSTISRDVFFRRKNLLPVVEEI